MPDSAQIRRVGEREEEMPLLVNFVLGIVRQDAFAPRRL